MYSKPFASYYDLLMGDYSRILNTTVHLITAYLPQNSSLLELGCGTGNMLQGLKENYVVSGLDLSPGMLTIARKKVPNATYYHDDISKFTIDSRFDAIFSVFDTINHIVSFKLWESVFARVHHHLKTNGIFIFDMNTMKRMNFLANHPTYVIKLNSETLTCIKVTKVHQYLYSSTFQIFEHISAKKVNYIEEVVEEASFPLERVQKALHKYFFIEERKDPFRQKVGRQSGRVFFVCRKK